MKIFLYQLYLQPAPLPRDALFRPIVTHAMYTPLPECDYNGHKSNSTYFSDLDMARTQLVAALLRTGIRAQRRPHDLTGRRVDAAAAPGAPQLPKGAFGIALGAVTCHFKREIKPYERFEIWTRVLAWDRKWVYVISHMVKPGTVAPAGWALQPWRRRWGAVAAAPPAGSAEETARQKEQWRKGIFASSISKYVVKKGRLTIAPEMVLRNSDLLPLKPEEEGSLAGSVGEMVAADGEEDAWTWEKVEAERQRGMRTAAHFDSLDAEGGLLDEFPASRMWEGEEVKVLGAYRDLYLG